MSEYETIRREAFEAHQRLLKARLARDVAAAATASDESERVYLEHEAKVEELTSVFAEKQRAVFNHPDHPVYGRKERES